KGQCRRNQAGPTTDSCDPESRVRACRNHTRTCTKALWDGNRSWTELRRLGRCSLKTHPHLDQHGKSFSAAPDHEFFRVTCTSPLKNTGSISRGVSEIRSIYCAIGGVTPNSHLNGASSSGKKLRFRQSNISTPDCAVKNLARSGVSN